MLYFLQSRVEGRCQAAASRAGQAYQGSAGRRWEATPTEGLQTATSGRSIRRRKAVVLMRHRRALCQHHLRGRRYIPRPVVPLGLCIAMRLQMPRHRQQPKQRYLHARLKCAGHGASHRSCVIAWLGFGRDAPRNPGFQAAHFPAPGSNRNKGYVVNL